MVSGDSVGQTSFSSCQYVFFNFTMQSSEGSQDAKRRRTESTTTFPEFNAIRSADNVACSFALKIISLSISHFGSLLQDASASSRAYASATLALVNTLSTFGASDLDHDTAVAASVWLNCLLNSSSFFSSHPTLIFQVIFFLPPFCSFSS
jgi:hypothetical protein